MDRLEARQPVQPEARAVRALEREVAADLHERGQLERAQRGVGDDREVPTHAAQRGQGGQRPARFALQAEREGPVEARGALEGDQCGDAVDDDIAGVDPVTAPGLIEHELGVLPLAGGRGDVAASGGRRGDRRSGHEPAERHQ